MREKHYHHAYYQIIFVATLKYQSNVLITLSDNIIIFYIYCRTSKHLELRALTTFFNPGTLSDLAYNYYELNLNK